MGNQPTPNDFFDRIHLIDNFKKYLKETVKMPKENEEIRYKIDDNTELIIQHVNNSKSKYIGDEKKYIKSILLYKGKELNHYLNYYGVSDIKPDRIFTSEEAFNGILNKSFSGVFSSNYYEKYVYDLEDIDSKMNESYNGKEQPIVVTLDVEIDDEEIVDMMEDFNANDIHCVYSSKYDTMKLFAYTRDAKYALCDYVCNYFYSGEYPNYILDLYPELEEYYIDCEDTFVSNYITK